MGSFSSFFARKFRRGIIFLFAILVGAGILGSSGQVYAGGGTFDVPEINDHFDQVNPSPEPEKSAPVTQPAKEENGFWDWITEPIADAWEWTRDKASAALNWSKETASAVWHGIVDVISKITEVTVGALSAVWDWILEYKGIVVAILSIVGVIVAVIGFAVGSSLALFIGGSILVGELISGLLSWISGNELFSDEMLFDMLVGGIAGGISALFGWVAGAGAAGSSVVRWLGTRIPWLGRIFPKIFGGSVGAGVDQSLWDLLRNGKINWVRTAIATGLGFVLVFGGETLGSHSDDIIKWINNRNVPEFAQSFVNSGDSLATTASMKIGDTPFGEWLQKFSAESGESGTTVGSSTVRITVQFAEGFDDHLIKGNGIGKRKKGVIGAHNMKEFVRTLEKAGENINHLINSKKQHPNYPGLFDIKYRIPTLTYDKSGKLVPSGQYKEIDYPKTVYDPEVYSDQQIIQWGKEAMQEGIDAGRVKNGRFVEGYSSNGMKFAGYLNDQGKIKNFYPVAQ
ncbi:CdiA family toxin C-terminal domain-containing protein [Thermoactinomyces mirandus]|uniref:EndoU domain-containing protein n=1 Tax=Thermoactinomyces mirandus TaxID=2756294 RepID=A0A7W1XRQ3_9BACL|nr:CdiA family toxin C-terminal domain-containing protein [Thermoactinomyces mirandus]MBA4601981.1 EndoU domain-containing protein [Thermoactinomyces mirandus]